MTETMVMPMTCEESIKDKRFRFAVHKGEYSRAISLFIRLRHPGIASEKLPKEAIQEAQIWVDNAFFDELQVVKQLEKEMI